MKVRVLVLMTVFGVVGGCDILEALNRFPFRGIDLKNRTPVPVDPDVDKVLTKWEKRRRDSKSLYATFKRSVRETAFNTDRVGQGSIRLRHGEVFRVDMIKPREVFLYTKKREFWHLLAESRIADVMVFDEMGPHSWASTPFVWFSPTTKETLQKHGRVRKTGETSTTIELRVENAQPGAQRGYEWMNVVLKKTDYLPFKLEVKENADTVVTYEFTEAHENVEFDEADFTPPKLSPEWRIHRTRLPIVKKPLAPSPPNNAPLPKSP